MALPPGGAPTFVNNVLYVACFDHTIHAVNAATGAKIWQTDKAEQGINVNPIVVNSRVYAGVLTVISTVLTPQQGVYQWSYNAGEPIQQSARTRHIRTIPKE